LLDTKESNFSKALTDYRKYIESSQKNQKICERDDVIDEMKQIWSLKKQQETDLTSKLLLLIIL
jgi:hypothetical protein